MAPSSVWLPIFIFSAISHLRLLILSLLDIFSMPTLPWAVINGSMGAISNSFLLVGIYSVLYWTLIGAFDLGCQIA